jgi:hypothetical protein
MGHKGYSGNIDKPQRAIQMNAEQFYAKLVATARKEYMQEMPKSQRKTKRCMTPGSCVAGP